MAKKIMMIAIAVMLLIACAACAEIALPAEGDVIEGFKVTAVEEFPLLQSQIVYFEHEKTGAQLVWVANDDTDRAFTVGFRTIDGSNKGTPHVFEHAALSGSVKYPDPSLFFNMMASTCQTYLNAETRGYATIYPCASLSEEQLLKFVDVYMAGVYEPLVLTDINAMRREAYRYELEDRDADLTLTGTVYSEMMGNYSANEDYYKMVGAMYPGSAITSCTGGMPGVIETMTQQDLIDFHDKYYRPSNSAMVLYGDLHVEPFLKLISEEYLDNFDDEPVVIEDAGYVPFTGYSSETFEVAASEETGATTTFYYGVRMPEMSLTEKSMAAVGSILLSSEGTPLKMTATEIWPDSILSIGIMTDEVEPIFMYQLDNAEGIDPEEFVSVVREKTVETLAAGLDMEMADSIISNLKKQQILGRESGGYGPTLGMSIMASYAMTGDIHSEIDTDRALLEQIEDYCYNGRMAEMLNYVSEFKDSKLVIIERVPGMAEANAAAAQQKLVDKKQSMTDEEIDQVIADTKEFEEWTTANESISMIDEVRVVRAEDLPVDYPGATIEDREIDGMRVVSSELEDFGLVEVTMYFDASHIAVEDLNRYELINQLTGSLSTDRHDYYDLPASINRYSMGITSTKIVTDGTDEYRPVLAVGMTCLPEDLDDAFEFMSELLYKTRFDELDLIRYRLNSNVYGTRMNASFYGNVLAMGMAQAVIIPSATYSYYLNDLPYYEYMEALCDADDAALAEELAVAEAVNRSVLNRKNFVMTVVGSGENIDHAIELTRGFYDGLTDEERTAVDYTAELEALPSRIAIMLNEDVYYNYAAVAMRETGVEYDGRFAAMDALVSDRILIPVMRYRNGVYSPHIDTDEKRTGLLAYRDPSISKTFESVLPSLKPTVDAMELTQEEMDGYIVNAYTELAAAAGPFTRAEVAVTDALRCGDSFEQTRLRMEALRNMKVEDLKDMSVIYEVLAEKGVRIVTGSAAGIREHADDFDLIIDWYIKN